MPTGGGGASPSWLPKPSSIDTVRPPTTRLESRTATRSADPTRRPRRERTTTQPSSKRSGSSPSGLGSSYCPSSHLRGLTSVLSPCTGRHGIHMLAHSRCIPRTASLRASTSRCRCRVVGPFISRSGSPADKLGCLPPMQGLTSTSIPDAPINASRLDASLDPSSYSPSTRSFRLLSSIRRHGPQQAATPPHQASSSSPFFLCSFFSLRSGQSAITCPFSPQ